MLNEFRNNKILLAYYAGSSAYGTRTGTSDIDIVVVLDDLNGSMHISNEELGIEYFVFGKEDYARKMTFSHEVSAYLKLFNDDILAVEQPIVLDESFVTDYENYRSRDFNNLIADYIDTVIEYYQHFLSENALKKNMYHLYRIEKQVKTFIDTGQFQITKDESINEKMMVFKENYQSNSMDYMNELRDILKYLKEVRKHVTD